MGAHRFSAAFATCCALTLVSGCGEDDAEPTAERTSSAAPEPTESTSESTPAEDGGLPVNGSAAITSAARYTALVSYRLGDPAGFVADATEAEPGRTDLVIGSPAQVATVDNTTSGRTLQASDLNLAPTALYEAGSAPCTSKLTVSPTFAAFQNDGPPAQVVVGSRKFCGVLLTPTLSFDGGIGEMEIPADGSAQLVDTRQRPPGARVFDVPEADADALRDELNQPAHVVVLLWGEGDDAWTAKEGCPVDRVNPETQSAQQVVAVSVEGSEPVCA